MTPFQCIIPISLFKRDTQEYLTRLETLPGPILLTIHGRGALVVDNLNSYLRNAELAEFARQDKALSAVLSRMQEPPE